MSINQPQSTKPILALFDLDHTLIPIDSDQQWGQFLALVGAVDSTTYAVQNEIYYQQYKDGTLDIHEFLNFGLQPLAQHSREQLLVWQNQYINQIIKPHITPQALNLLYNIRRTGAICALVTATNSFISLPIARLLGFNEHNLIATEPNTQDNCPWYTTSALFTGQVLGIPNFKENKVHNIEQWLAKQNLDKQSFAMIQAYSDSHNDIPMLEWATMAIATNPDAILTTYAQQKYWPILSLFG